MDFFVDAVAFSSAVARPIEPLRIGQVGPLSRCQHITREIHEMTCWIRNVTYPDITVGETAAVPIAP